MHEWGHRYGSEVNDTVGPVVGELAANAVTHGLVPGRGVLLRLIRAAGGWLRVEVSDTRGEWLPVPPTDLLADAETGRGLVRVAALAEEEFAAHEVLGRRTWVHHWN